MVKRFGLTIEERVELTRQHKLERDKRICDRIKAVLAYDDGYSYSEIAKVLLLDDVTIRRHIEAYFSSHKLKPENGGTQSYLSETEAALVKMHLEEVTYLYVKDICVYVQKTFGKLYSISGMTKWLKKNKFCYKKPHAVPAKADKARQEAFIDEYNSLKKEAGENEPIYFVDSVHPQHQTRLTYGWIRKGHRKLIPSTGRQYRVNIIGGICLNGHKFFYQKVEKVDSINIKNFLSSLRKKNKQAWRLHIIWDNAGYHHSKDIIKYADKLGIKIHYLPPYSPNLNPIERLWKIMHEQVSYNRYYEKFADFTEKIINFLKTIGRKKTILRARINDNFHVIHSPLIAL